MKEPPPGHFEDKALMTEWQRGGGERRRPPRPDNVVTRAMSPNKLVR